MASELHNLLNLVTEQVAGVPVGKTRVWTFRPKGVVDIPEPKTMRLEATAEGVEITAEYEATEAMMEALITLLEQNGYTVTRSGW